jgi:hypothetical protein
MLVLRLRMRAEESESDDSWEEACGGVVVW